MEYHMCTAQGTSEAYNKHSEMTPVFGVGQGATNAQTKWTFTYNNIIKVFNKKMIGCSLVGPTGTIKITKNLVKIVDDNSLLHNNKGFATPIQALIKQVQHDVGL
eukprot:15358638-Ditylum_brightwellii.AAC.1